MSGFPDRLTRLARPAAVSAVLLVLAVAGTQQASGQGGTATADPVDRFGCSRPVAYGAGRFGSTSHAVDHPLLPLAPGTQRVFEGRSSATGSPLPHRVTFTVTSLTKEVDGVRSAVVWDVDESDGALAETELAMFAQDSAGNVWNVGEYPEEYPGGVFRGAPSAWFGGVGDAEPGIHMLKQPTVGSTEYLQGWVPSIEFLDCAKVVRSGASVCVPAGCFQNVLVIHERSPLDPDGGIQVKYHAPGRGIVQIGALDDPEGETLVLTKYRQLSASELQAANREAHILDQRGLQCSAIYAQTTPVEGPDDGDYGPYTCPAPPASSTVTTPAPFSVAPAGAPPPAAPEPPRPAGPGYRRWVDHPMFPLRRVRTMVYEGTEGDARVRIESHVRGKRVRVAGVPATAVDVEERENGKLVERSTDFYVQDQKGNVWSLGERVDELDDGRVTGHDGQWTAGRENARPGLVMPAAPRVGQSFRNARAPGVAKERSTVLGLSVAVTARAGRFKGCLEIREMDLRRRGAPSERKLYCPDVGLVRERLGDGLVELARYG